MADWKKDLDPVIANRLKELIKETKVYDDSIRKSKDKSKAQLWVALAILYDRIKHLENEESAKETNMSEDELNKVLKIMEDL